MPVNKVFVISEGTYVSMHVSICAYTYVCNTECKYV